MEDNVPANSKKHIVIKRILAIISALIFIGLFAWVGIAFGMPLIDQLFGSATDPSQIDLTYFRNMVADEPITARLIYIGIQILQVFVALIPGEVVEVAGGIAFNPFEGAGLALIGVAIASSMVFGLTKLFGIRFVELFVSRERINDMAIIRSDSRLNSFVFLIFFIPGTPKDLLTYFVGLTRMKLSTFLLLSLTARIPSVLSSTLAGDAIVAKNYITAIIIFAVTGVLAAVGFVVYKMISKKRSTAKSSAQ